MKLKSLVETSATCQRLAKLANDFWELHAFYVKKRHHAKNSLKRNSYRELVSKKNLSGNLPLIVNHPWLLYIYIFILIFGKLGRWLNLFGQNLLYIGLGILYTLHILIQLSLLIKKKKTSTHKPWKKYNKVQLCL